MEYIGILGNKKTIARRAILVGFVVITFLFQSTGGLFPEPFGIKTLLLIPLTICISMFEREFAGIFYGLLSGVMLDAFSAQSSIFNSLMFTIFGFAAGSLITYLMRNNLLCATILTTAAAVFYNVISFIVYSAFDSLDKPVAVFFRYYFTSAVFTILLTPVYYFIVRLISKQLKS